MLDRANVVASYYDVDRLTDHSNQVKNSLSSCLPCQFVRFYIQLFFNFAIEINKMMTKINLIVFIW